MKIQNVVTIIYKIKTINDSNKIEKFGARKIPAKLKTLESKDLNNLVPFNRFRVVEEKEIDEKENNMMSKRI